MAKCPKCGFDEDANFCRQCGTPIAGTRTATTKSPAKETPESNRTQQMNLVCPKCEAQNLYPITASASEHTLNCPKCSKTFTTKIFQVRAKSSRGSKQENRRSFSVRVIDAMQREELIEFVNASHQDFELRARDLAAFSYLNGKLRVVQNCTVARYMKVSEPACFIATYLYGPNSEEVAILRGFRDVVLSPSPILSPVVEVYYKTSPALTECMRNSHLLKSIALRLVDPIVALIRKWDDHKGQSNLRKSSQDAVGA